MARELRRIVVRGPREEARRECRAAAVHLRPSAGHGHRLKWPETASDAAGGRAAAPMRWSVIPVLGALTSAAAYVLLFAPFEQPWLGWVALVPLFLVLDGAPPRRAAATAGLWAALATAGVVAWLVPTFREHFELGAVASGGLLLGIAAVAAAPWCALAFAGAAATARRLPRGAGPVLLAAAFVAGEFARTELGIRSPWARLGDAFYAADRLRQVAALGGVYAVTAVVVLVNAALARALRRLGPRPGGAPAPAPH